MPVRKRGASIAKRHLDGVDKAGKYVDDGVNFASKAEELKALLEQKEGLDKAAETFADRRQGFLNRLPDFKPNEEHLNRIIVPTSYLHGAPGSDRCSLSIPGERFTLSMNAGDFRHLPVDTFGEDFAKSHIALCLQPDVKELSPVYRSDYDWTLAGKMKPMSIDGLANKFTEVCTMELLGPDAVRNMSTSYGEFNIKPVMSCTDSYDVMAKTVASGTSPVQDWHEKTLAAYMQAKAFESMKPDINPNGSKVDVVKTMLDKTDGYVSPSGPKGDFKYMGVLDAKASMPEYKGVSRPAEPGVARPGIDAPGIDEPGMKAMGVLDAKAFMKEYKGASSSRDARDTRDLDAAASDIIDNNNMDVSGPDYM